MLLLSHLGPCHFLLHLLYVHQPFPFAILSPTFSQNPKPDQPNHEHSFSSAPAAEFYREVPTAQTKVTTASWIPISAGNVSIIFPIHMAKSSCSSSPIPPPPTFSADDLFCLGTEKKEATRQRSLSPLLLYLHTARHPDSPLTLLCLRHWYIFFSCPQGSFCLLHLTLY